MKKRNGFYTTAPGQVSPASLVELQALALEATANAAVITDRMGTMIWVNAAFQRLTGYASSEVLGQSTRILKSGKNLPALYEEMWRTISRGESWQGELTNRRKDGGLYEEEMTITPLRDREGNISNFLAIKQDISERRRTEERIRMLAKAVESSPDMIGMGAPDGGILYVNEALQIALQQPRENLVGKHFQSMLSPNNPPGLVQEIINGSSQPGGWRGECFVPRQDGTDLPVLLSSSAVVAEDGKIVGILGIATNIAERKQAEQDIRALTERLTLATAAAKIGVWELDLASKTFTWDATTFEIYGFPPTPSVQYQQWSRAVYPEDLPEVEAVLHRGIAEKTMGRAEFRILLPDGATKHILAIGRPVADENQNVSRVLGTAQDITAQKQAEQEILFKNTLLEAQAETTIDGILAVNESNQIILYNTNLAAIFGIPSALIHEGDHTELLQRIANNVENPQEFKDRVKYLYAHKQEKSRDEIRLNDGRALDRYSSPLVDSKGVYHGRIWYFRDITERVRSEERMRLWSRVLDQSGEGIFICDPHERILIVNTAFERLTGFSASEAVGKTPRMLQSGRQDRTFYVDMWKSVLETGRWRGEIWNRRKGGEIYAEWLSISTVYDDAGAVTHYIGIFSDITAHKQAAERIAHLAHYDALTDLPNRVLLMDRLSQLTKAARRRKHKVAVVFIDLDRFKDVNDSLGHQAGDLLLQIVAKRFTKVMRAEDTLARIGGDEFVAVFQGLQGGQDAAVIAKELFSCLAAPIPLNGHEIAVTASMGISLYPDDATDGHEMIRNADAAMYQAKAGGRNAYQFYTSELNQRALEILSMESGIRRGIEHQQFILYYQPQIDIASGSVVGAEALIRWKHPDWGLVMPGKFISVAEERGLILPLGTWVIDEAARQAAAWQHAGMPIRIALNVSAAQFRQKNFVEDLFNSIQKHGATPTQIEIELTERSIMRDADETIKTLERLHEMGFQLAIDDFGTGYSSLSYLRHFSVDKIKIDQSFVKDEYASHIVTAIIGLARGFKLKVIAEGVETRKQLEMLREQGCDEAQGFFFSPALNVESFEQFIRARNPLCGANESSVLES